MEIKEAFNRGRLFDVFGFNLALLKYRIGKLSEINGLDPNNKFEMITYFDASIVQIRAMFLERRSQNFTFQSFLRAVDRSDLIEKVEAFFDEPFNAADAEMRDDGLEYRSLRKVIKFVADKFVCHNDVTDFVDQGNQDYYAVALTNPYDNRYLPNMLKELFLIFDEIKTEK